MSSVLNFPSPSFSLHTSQRFALPTVVLYAMLFFALITFSLLIASAVGSPAPVLENRGLDPGPAIEARVANPTIYVRIEGPTKTIYEQTIVASSKAELTNGGHTAPCKSPHYEEISLLY